jgi:hypothetical protein
LQLGRKGIVFDPYCINRIASRIALSPAHTFKLNGRQFRILNVMDGFNWISLTLGSGYITAGIAADPGTWLSDSQSKWNTGLASY